MKICVTCAGAIGGLLAAKLAQAGETVRVIARGAHLAAILENGLSLLEEGGEIALRVKASDRIADAGQQDLIRLGAKVIRPPRPFANKVAILQQLNTARTPQMRAPRLVCRLER